MSTIAPGAPGRVGASDPDITLSLASYDPAASVSAQDPYDRSYQAISAVLTMLEQLQAAGAAGAIAVLNAPPDAAKGADFPYDGIVRSIPGLFVDQTVGAQLEALAAGTQVRLTLPRNRCPGPSWWC